MTAYVDFGNRLGNDFRRGKKGLCVKIEIGEIKKNRIKQDIEMLEQQLDELTEKSKIIHKESDAAKLLLAIKCNSYTTLLAVLEMHLDLLEASK